eukprot:NODE_446_length_8505_cov_0.322032.p4 type:complete len:181 gc:universal NODE_446_length_8505_cov_0.322032:7704-8246(+)
MQNSPFFPFGMSVSNPIPGLKISYQKNSNPIKTAVVMRESFIAPNIARWESNSKSSVNLLLDEINTRTADALTDRNEVLIPSAVIEKKMLVESEIRLLPLVYGKLENLIPVKLLKLIVVLYFVSPFFLVLAIYYFVNYPMESYYKDISDIMNKLNFFYSGGWTIFLKSMSLLFVDIEDNL